MPRHPNDTIERLHPGAADPTSPWFVPIAVRAEFAAIPDEVTRKLARRARSTTGAVHRGSREIIPSRSEREYDEFLHILKVQHAEMTARTRELQAERAAYDRRNYTCQACSTVSVPLGLRGQGTLIRPFPDGSRYLVCERCAPLVERAVLDRLAAESTPAGLRGTAVAKLLGGR